LVGGAVINFFCKMMYCLGGAVSICTYGILYASGDNTLSMVSGAILVKQRRTHATRRIIIRKG